MQPVSLHLGHLALSSQKQGGQYIYNNTLHNTWAVSSSMGGGTTSELEDSEAETEEDASVPDTTFFAAFLALWSFLECLELLFSFPEEWEECFL